MDLILLTQGKEWDMIWDWLAKHPINENVPDPTLGLHNGYAWEYMGTYHHRDRYLHNFRHKCHPLTNGLKELVLTGSEYIDPDEIAKSFKLK